MIKNTITRKFESLNKILFKNKLTSPRVMGNNILILACAPCVNAFFEYESVRTQFESYDIAFINYMIIYSETEMFNIKPKYIILIDPIFYMDDFEGKTEKKRVASILNKIDWECVLVTSVLADFDVTNEFVTIHRISCFESPYKKIFLPLYKKNRLSIGLYNIMQAAIYYAITFGYKKIAILGCNYQMAELKVINSGLRITDPMHYYDDKEVYEYISWEQIWKSPNGYVSLMFERAQKSAACFFGLAKYANEMGAEITNYSDNSALDGFKNGELIIEED